MRTTLFILVSLLLTSRSFAQVSKRVESPSTPPCQVVVRSIADTNDAAPAFNLFITPKDLTRCRATPGLRIPLTINKHLVVELRFNRPVSELIEEVKNTNGTLIPARPQYQRAAGYPEKHPFPPIKPGEPVFSLVCDYNLGIVLTNSKGRKFVLPKKDILNNVCVSP